MRAAIVAGVDAAPVLELAEHILDPVALTVECAVVRDRDFAVSFGRDAGGDALCDQGVSKPVGIVAPVAELAERMNTSQSSIARLESGRSRPSTRTLEKLAAATGSKLRIILDPADGNRAA